MKKWTLNEIVEEASKFKYRAEFKKNSTAYKAALRRGILNQVCSHMDIRRIIWNEELIQIEALKFDNRSEFKKNNNGAYKAAKRLNILDQVCSHMDILWEKKWTIETIQIEASQYQYRTEFQKNSTAYKAAFKLNILDQVCSHMPKRIDRSGDNNPAFKWTLEMIQYEALKFNTRTEFKENSPKAYDAAIRQQIMGQVCSHMKVILTHWTFELIQKESLKHNTRRNFCKKCPGAYKAAQRLGILDQVCCHMKRSNNSSIPELELLNIIKQQYPTAKKLRHTKIQIPNKPHIKRFEIDIYIPELNKGIEFDGKYHHSFEGLKRSRPHWPDEDIRNYHQIKDAYFLSRGIELLHIKGKDWNLNKDEQIKKCFEFLGIDNGI